MKNVLFAQIKNVKLKIGPQHMDVPGARGVGELESMDQGWSRVLPVSSQETGANIQDGSRIDLTSEFAKVQDARRSDSSSPFFFSGCHERRR